MGVLKIHHIDPSVVANMGESSSTTSILMSCSIPSPGVDPPGCWMRAAGLVDRLRQMLSSEGDAQVLANCVTVIGQV
jgi:hypothetical protein